MSSPNKNGTYDDGPMQINSIWLKKIAPYGDTKEHIHYNPCINVQVGTWILSQEIADGQHDWQGVGSYHSHTFKRNQHDQLQVRAPLNLRHRDLTSA